MQNCNSYATKCRQAAAIGDMNLFCENFKELMNNNTSKWINEKNKSEERTMLHYVFIINNTNDKKPNLTGKIQIAELLLKANANCSIQDKYGDTPFHYLCKLLGKNLHEACKKKDVAKIKFVSVLMGLAVEFILTSETDSAKAILTRNKDNLSPPQLFEYNFRPETSFPKLKQEDTFGSEILMPEQSNAAFYLDDKDKYEESIQTAIEESSISFIRKNLNKYKLVFPFAKDVNLIDLTNILLARQRHFYFTSKLAIEKPYVEATYCNSICIFKNEESYKNYLSSIKDFVNNQATEVNNKKNSLKDWANEINKNTINEFMHKHVYKN